MSEKYELYIELSTYVYTSIVTVVGACRPVHVRICIYNNILAA